MLLHGAFLPPRAAIEEVLAVVRSVVPPPTVTVTEPPSRGLFGRRSHRRDEAGPAAVSPDPLELLLAETMSLPITGFGNLTTNDAYRLADVLGGAAAAWPAPTVNLAGGTALDFPGDWCVWAKLAGDVDELATIARAVTRTVEQLGFFVDRRGFRPMLALARVTPATTGPYLERIVEALEGFVGQEWVVGDIALTTVSNSSDGPAFTEFRRIPLPV